MLALADLRAIVNENGELMVFKSYSASSGGLAEPASYCKSARLYLWVNKAWQCMISSKAETRLGLSDVQCFIPVGRGPINKLSGTSHLPCNPIFIRIMLGVMYETWTSSGDTSAPSSGMVLVADVKLPFCADPACHVLK